jgi:hypothetical protein
MLNPLIFQYRKEKEDFLKKIIKKLSISETEKELYTISLEILEERDFNNFFTTIVSQINEESEGQKNTIAPLTSTLL